MLIYRGLSRIANWNESDINQILRGLSICSMSIDTEKARMLEEWSLPKSLKGIPDGETPAYTEYCLYKIAIVAILDFLRELKRSGITEFDNPPIEFIVDGNTVYIHPSSVKDVYGKGFIKQSFCIEIAQQIKDYVKDKEGNRYKVVFHKDVLLSDNLRKIKGGEIENGIYPR